MPEEYVVGPEGEDDYRHFVIPYEADQDQFIEAIDVQPGNRNVVHHAIGYVDTSGTARGLDAEDSGPGCTRFVDVAFLGLLHETEYDATTMSRRAPVVAAATTNHN
jgi:hypothetical protein